jgi:hypothetical protein
MIIASCGHKVESLDDLVNCSLAAHSRSGHRCIEYVSVCEGCFDWYKREGVVLFDAGEENKWLGCKNVVQ